VDPLLKPDLDVLLVDRYKSDCIYEVPENVTGLGRLIAVAKVRGQQPILTARHQGQLQITVNLHGHGG
jgi:hypothetical protein